MSEITQEKLISQRGRKKGSKNKPKQTSGLFNVLLEKQIKNTPICRENALGWVNFGSRNTYPYDLLDLYNQSVTHHAAIDFFQNAVVGQGLDFEAMNLSEDKLQMPNKDMDWTTFIRSLAFDLGIFNAFAFEIILNKDRKTYSYYYIDFSKVRLSAAKDEDGKPISAFICEDWSAYMKYGYQEIPIYHYSDGERIEYGKPYIYIYMAQSPLSVYPTPFYSAGIRAIQSECEIMNFELRHIVNNFAPSGVLTLPPTETDEEKEAIVNNVQRMFTGSDNANNLMITFSNGISGEDGNNVHFEPFVKDNTADIYQSFNNRTIERICAAHKIPSKSLIGYQLEGNGFSSEGSLLEAAYSLYNINMASTYRNILTNAINQALKANGVDANLILKPLQYQLEDAEDQSNETNEENVVEENNNE